MNKFDLALVLVLAGIAVDVWVTCLYRRDLRRTRRQLEASRAELLAHVLSLPPRRGKEFRA